MPLPSPARQNIPTWLRWSALLWLLVWFPIYWHAWGAANFLHLCDVAVILTCIGLWSGNALLISSQAVSSLLIDVTWALDAAWRYFLGHHLIGGTEYLFDARFPLGVRVLSLFHLVMPPLLLRSLHRVGYDRRGWPLQSAIALVLFIASRFTDPTKNLNFAFRDAFFHRTWGPAPIHIAISLLLLIFVVYFPTHLLLKTLFPPPSRSFNSQQPIAGSKGVS
jgi:hypothetical protein